VLYWIPLGAGGVGFVRRNGKIYEAAQAFRDRRRPLSLYHTALEVLLPEGRFVIENAWPSPDNRTEERGVVTEGPVFSQRLARWRWFRYEIRRWRDGVIPDMAEAVGGPQLLTADLVLTRAVLDSVASVPTMVWGRDELGVGEMWNSNSVISWLLARNDLLSEEVQPPPAGRAPGWQSGVVAAGR
jgi:hypothetical protein